MSDVPDGFKMTEIGILPDGWNCVELGSNIKQSRDKNKNDEPHKVYTVSNVYGMVLSDEFFDKKVYSRDTSTYKIIECGDFAYNPYRINVGSLGLFRENGKGLVSPAYVVFKVVDDKLYGEFLLNLLKSPSYASEISRYAMARGSVRRSLAYKDLSMFLVPLPPLPEQKKIAAVLSTVQDAKEKTEAVIQAARELKKSLMKHLFTYGPVSPKDAADVPLQETEIGMVPDEWNVVKLGNLAELITKGSSPKWQGFEYLSDGIVFVRSQNVGWGKLELMKTAYLSEEFNKKEKKSIIHRDDLLINIVGASIGRAAMANEFVEGGNLNQAVAIVRLMDSTVNAFIMTFLLFDAGQVQLHRQKKEIARANINLQDIGNLLVPLPTLPIQQQIADILSAVDQKIEAEEGRRQALDELFKTLLSNLMTGRPQEARLLQ